MKMLTSPFATSPASNIGFVHLNMLPAPASNPVLIGMHHARTELMQNAEGGFITGKTDLALELCGRHAGCLAGNKISRPKPHAEWRMGTLHNRSHRQPGVTAALPAAQNAGPVGEAERLSRRMAMRADESIIPPRLLQIGGTSSIVREKSLELGKRLRK